MVTIVMPVSRPDYLRQIFANLEYLRCNPSETNLLTYVDAPQSVFEIARNLTVNSKFGQKLCVYRSKKTYNVGSFKRRRQRIADIHNEIKPLIEKADHIFIVEDDTLIPLDALEKMLHVYDNNPYAGIVSGVQIGRWGFSHIGAWKFNDIYSPSVITSVRPDIGLHEVDATGFYCCLIKRDNYDSHNFAPFDDVLGPDVNFGISMRRIGLKNYVDHSIKCAHLTKRGKIDFSNTEIIQVSTSVDVHGKWSGWRQEVDATT